MQNYEKHCFVKVWTSFDLRSNLGLTRGILVILAEKDTLSALVPKRVAPHCSRCSLGPIERKWYFWIFLGVQHINWGRTKYGINSCLFFIWYLECNERCRIKNLISNFVTPKLECGDYLWTEIELYLLGSICCSCYWNIFWMRLWPLGEEKGEDFFFWGFDRVSVDLVNVARQCWALEGPLGIPEPIKGLLAHFTFSLHSSLFTKIPRGP